MKTAITLLIGTILGGISSVNAQTWSGLSNGTDGSVTALSIGAANNLFVGGHFDNVSSTASQKFAEWNGTVWTPYALGADYPLHELYYDTGNGYLYAGGEFLSIGGISANRIAYYDGANWNALGLGLNASVNKIIRYNGELYAGTLSGLFQWNGSAWVEMNLSGNPYVIITDMEIYQGELYVGGSFETAGGFSANGVAKWNGSAWSTLGSGLDQNGLMDVMEVFDNELYIGGIFSSLNGVNAGSFAKWNGTTAFAVGTGVPVISVGFPNRVSALQGIGTNLYVGGYFNEIDGVSASNIAQYSGGSFLPMANGVNNSVFEMANYNGDLIVGGAFTTAGAATVNYIAKWDGLAAIDEEAIQFEVFPNPFSDEFHVVSESSAIQSLSVFDVLGSLVWESEFDGEKEVKVSLKGIPAGAYTAEMTYSSGQSVRKKLLKQ